MPHDNPVMFCHDSHSIYYPTGPGRVYAIPFDALYDCTGSDEDFADSVSVGDLRVLVYGPRSHGAETLVCLGDSAPGAWPRVRDDKGINHVATAEDWADALEQWADWCDRDSARLDSLDEVKGRIERAA
jgi:hypothetical protein